MILVSAKVSVHSCLFWQVLILCICHLSNFWSGSLLYNITFLMDLRKAFDFALWLAFNLLRWSCNFQAPYMLNEKLEILHFS